MGKIYALNSVILNFYFLLTLLNNTLLHGVVTILTIVYSACAVRTVFLTPIPSHITVQTRAYLRQKPKNQKLLQMW